MATEVSFESLRALPTSEHSIPSLPLPADSSSPSSLQSVTSTATGSSISSGYVIESQVGQEVVAKICYSALSRILEFPDDKFEALITPEGDSGAEGQRSIAQNIRDTLRLARRSIEVHQSSHPRWERVREGSERTASAGDDVDGAGGVECEPGLKGPLGPTLLRLMAHMESMTSTEGLFRVPGNKVRVDRLMAAIDRSDWAAIADAHFCYKPHDFASALKHYLAHLPEPLLPGNHLEAYLQAADLSDVKLRLKCLQLLTLLLHPTHRLVLQKLLELLQSVCGHQAVSKMSAHSLSLVFSPNLIREPNHAPLVSDSLKKFFGIVEFMIDNGCSIFEVPTDVQELAERYVQRKSSGEVDAPLGLASSCCRQMPVASFHSEGRERALEEVSKLYAYVQSLPSGAQKTHFLKKFESSRKIPGTPQPYTKPSRVWKKFFTPSKLTLEKGISSSECSSDTPTAQKRPCFRKGTLTDTTNTTPLHRAATTRKQLHVDSDRSTSEAGGAPLKVGVAATPIAARSRAASEMKVTAV